jgi:polar amino acid transport system substrate-binding protein
MLLLGFWVFAGAHPERLFFRRDHVWREMQSRGTWRVGMDPSFPPFEDLNDGGQPVGYDVDLAERMAAEWGLELEIVAIGFDSLMDALQAGKVDSIVSAIPYDPRETKDFAFSPPYFEAGVRLAVARDSPIVDLDDLAGRTVAVEWGSMGDMVGRRLQRDGVAVELVPYSTPDDVVAALAEERAVDALLIDNVSLRQAQGRGNAIVAVGPALESNPYVIVSPHHAGELREQIANTLRGFQQDGVLDQLEADWFGTAE